MLDSFTNILNANDVWDRLAQSQRTLNQNLANAPYPFRFRMELAELLTHHIPEMLLTLGYRPPPPSEKWTDLVQSSVRRLLVVGQDDSKSYMNAAQARQELYFFTRRLRILVEAVEEDLRKDEKKDDSRSEALRHSLRSAVSAARDRAIPAALAAGAGAAVGGVAGGPAGMGIAFLSGGAASLLATATQAAATAWLAEAGHGDTHLVSPVSPVSAVRADVEALDECIELLRSATSATMESIRFIIRRGVFQTLQDAADATVLVRQFLWRWSKAFLSQLDERVFFSIDEAHQAVDKARAVLAGFSDR